MKHILVGGFKGYKMGLRVFWMLGASVERGQCSAKPNQNTLRQRRGKTLAKPLEWETEKD